jgi:ABC-type branched-subunit amino acid transport system ATPase component
MHTLEVRNVTKSFGGLVALSDVSMNADKGKIVGLIGPNGSGKTTLFNIITGFLKPDSGAVFLEGEDITDLKPHRIARKGLCKTFQLTKVFRKLTVLENLLAVLPEKAEGAARKLALESLSFFNLRHLQDEEAGNLSFGQQKLLELARVLMLDPKVILLDEPAAGINPVLMDKIIAHLIEMRKMRKAIVVVEHHLSTVFRLANEIVVLDHGEEIACGSPEEIKESPKVIKAYLGKEN